MRNPRGKRVELTKDELDVIVDLGLKELKRQLARKEVKAGLLSLVNKATRARAGEWPTESDTGG